MYLGLVTDAFVAGQRGSVGSAQHAFALEANARVRKAELALRSRVFALKFGALDELVMRAGGKRPSARV